MTTGRILARLVPLSAPVGETKPEFYQRKFREQLIVNREQRELLKHYIRTEEACYSVIRHQLYARGLPAELDDAIALVEEELEARI